MEGAVIAYRIEERISRPPGEIQIGTTVREMMKVGSKMAPFGWEVTEYSPGASFAFHTIERPVSWNSSYPVEPAGPGSTRVIGLGRVGLKGWQRLLEPFMGGEIRRGEAAELAKLKALLEGLA